MTLRSMMIMVIVTASISFAATATPTGPADLVWSTFLGGSDSDEANGLAVDGSGNVYLVGSTRSLEFPATPGAFDTAYNDKTDAFVMRVNADGRQLNYATYLGGNGGDRGFDIAVDDSGCTYVTGFTYSGNFPITAGAYDTEHNSPGGVYHDVFAAKLDPAGSTLLYATYLGGSYGEGGYGLAVDEAGRVTIAGDTQSSDFPVTAEAYDTTYNGNKDIFVVRLNPSGSDLEYSTFMGGSSAEYCEDLDPNPSGGVWVTGETQSSDFPTTGGAFDETYNDGHDAFVFKLNAAGSALEYSSFVGANQWDRGIGVAADDSDGLYLTGYTNSTGFPHTLGSFDPSHNGGRDVFIIKLDPVKGGMVYGAFLGGSADDRGLAIAVDDSGRAAVTGRTASVNFPVSPGAFDAIHNGDDDIFVARISATGDQLLYATYLGGESYEYGHGIALGPDGTITVAGISASDDFPTTDGAFDPTFNGYEDIVVARLELSITPVDAGSPAAGLPQAYLLRQNYPNPFNPATTIEYTLLQDGFVSLGIYDVRGALIATLVDRHQPAGCHTVRWDAGDLASGVYFCVLQAGDARQVRKMVLLK